MADKKLITIIGTFNPNSWYGPRLELKGPFDRKALDKVLLPFRPNTCSDEYEAGRGQATFVVRDEKQAQERANILNEQLQPYGFVIKYNSPTS